VTDLKGKTAIVTGGASGIGRATVLALAQAGARVVIADIALEQAMCVGEQVSGLGGAALALRFDVAKDNFEDLRDRALDHFDHVDIIMNNVGVMTNGRPEAIPLTEWQRVIEVNLLSVVKSNAAFIPLLIGQGHGHIVNTSSFAGLYTYAYDRQPYAACKAALIQISEGLAIYLRPQGVEVTVLCPGPVMTGISANAPTFGEAVPLRAPDPRFCLLHPSVVGEMVVEAILQKRFMVQTHPDVTELLLARASDWDNFIQQQIDHPNIITRPSTSASEG
jgi:NAD(P)-dependent dehydrogenase (short-subunit alcohol dehydrogenase family)